MLPKLIINSRFIRVSLPKDAVLLFYKKRKLQLPNTGVTLLFIHKSWMDELFNRLCGNKLLSSKHIYTKVEK